MLNVPRRHSCDRPLSPAPRALWARSSTPGTSPKRVLLTGPSGSVLDALKRALTRAGHRVTVAPAGDVLRQAAAVSPQLVVAVVSSSPGLGAGELGAVSGAHPAAPVVIVAERVSSGQAYPWFRLGFDEFLLGDVAETDPIQLRAAIERAPSDGLEQRLVNASQ